MAGTIIPNIVKNGLIYYSDVANTKFYEGGTSCTSLITGESGSLVNGVGLTGGTLDNSFVFDGIDDYVSIQNGFKKELTALPFSLDCWVYIDPLTTSFNGIFYSSMDSVYRGFGVQCSVSGSNVGFTAAFGDGLGFGFGNRRSFSSPVSFSFNTWYHIGFAVTDYNTAKFYCNGDEYSVTITGGYTSNSINVSNNYPSYFGKAWAYPYYFSGKISNFKAYDRILTQDEFKQNFEAHRKRYNI